MSPASERQRRYVARHRERVLARKKRYRERNKAKIALAWKKWAEANRDHLREKYRKARLSNPIKHRTMVRESHRRARQRMSDWYLCFQVFRTNIKLPADLLELKRAQLQLKRLCRKSQPTQPCA